MSMTKQHIYGDQVMPLLKQAEEEMNEQDTHFVLDERLSFYEDDVQNYARIRLVFIDIYTALKQDDIRGESALTRLDQFVFSPHRDLIFRLIESERYPAIRDLYRFMESHYY